MYKTTIESFTQQQRAHTIALHQRNSREKLSTRTNCMYKLDDTLAVFFYTHAVAGVLGGLLTGLFAHPDLCALSQTPTELSTALDVVSTTLILLAIKMFIPLRMAEEELGIGDDAAHGDEAYALWGKWGEV
ncbi:hypothetical protein Bca52824_006627 [Brassica carinata]|uniref:Ammonium transporter AmtB-like domain-containing protein n=1 Tax=Brassica carinata TaxID=52824 RepID=A0A8X7W6A8_BRACI|nr:hypothetical protein Bca52824_006627 [Brassica carinata]